MSRLEYCMRRTTTRVPSGGVCGVTDRPVEARTPDAAQWARERLEFEPDAVQADLLSNGAYRLILNCTRQWGKSTVTAAKAVHTAMFTPGRLILVISPCERQSAEFVRKAAGFLRKLGIKPRGDGDNNVSLVLPNDSRIVGLPGTEGTIRGFSAPSLLIIDEASRVADEQYDAVLPMLSVSDGALWLMSTPRGKRGFFYEIWSKKEPEWRRVSVPATECPRIKPEILEWQRKAMGELMFSQEYMCQFIDIETSLFDRDRLLAAVREDVRPLW